MNSFTTARAPLRPVAEHSGVLQQQIEGLIARDGKHGPFQAVGVVPASLTPPKDEPPAPQNIQP